MSLKGFFYLLFKVGELFSSNVGIKGFDQMLLLGGSISQEMESVKFIRSEKRYINKNQSDGLENFSQNFYIYLNTIKLYKRPS